MRASVLAVCARTSFFAKQAAAKVDDSYALLRQPYIERAAIREPALSAPPISHLQVTNREYLA